MILRSLARAIREQNYYAVFLEFVIVIAGIVIGFQINQWAADRAAAERADLMLDRLHEEAEANVAYYAPFILLYERENEWRIELIERFLAGDLEGADPEILTRAIMSTGLLPAAAPPGGIYDEIVNAGMVSSIGDEALRYALAEYWSGVEWLKEQIAFFRQLRVSRPAPTDFDFVRLEYDPDSSRKRRNVVDLEAAARSEPFMQWLLQANNSARAMTTWWRSTQARARELCAETSRLTGRPCEPEIDMPDWAQ